LPFASAVELPHVGEVISVETRERLAEGIVEELVAVISGTRTPAAAAVVEGSDFAEMSDAKSIVISGGVSEYIYAQSDRRVGDLGPDIASRLRSWVLGRSSDSAVLAGAGIRATVAGISQYTVQVSGSTVCAVGEFGLPVRNVPVVVVDLQEVAELGEPFVAGLVAHALEVRQLDPQTAVALSIIVGGLPTYRRLKTIAEGLCTGLDDAQIAPKTLVVAFFDLDVAATVGRLIAEELYSTRRFLCLDNIAFDDLAFTDIGGVIEPSGVFPVVVKSLIFSDGSAVRNRIRPFP
jgi:ethanolamine utilization protein EutA